MMSYFEMSGYAAYVWPAYGATFLVLALNIIAVYLESKEER